MGVRFDQAGNLLTTNIVSGTHEVLIFPAADINGSWPNLTRRSKTSALKAMEMESCPSPTGVADRQQR